MENGCSRGLFAKILQFIWLCGISTQPCTVSTWGCGISTPYVAYKNMKGDYSSSSTTKPFNFLSFYLHEFQPLDSQTIFLRFHVVLGMFFQAFTPNFLLRFKPVSSHLFPFPPYPHSQIYGDFLVFRCNFSWKFMLKTIEFM